MRGIRMYLKDEGHGVTRKSLAFWQENKHLIGKVICIEGDREGLYKEERESGGIPYTVDYTLLIFGTRGAILLSGCNCGYGGEGPNGTAKILHELGSTMDDAHRTMCYKQFHFSATTHDVEDCLIVAPGINFKEELGG